MTIVSNYTRGNVAYAATFNQEEDIYYVRVAPVSPVPLGAVSRKTHGTSGTYDVLPPLSGMVGVECRGNPTGRANLTNVSDAQTLSIKLTNVNDGTALGDVTIPMCVLLGDTSADHYVNSADATQVRNRSGQAVDAGNFRTDVNLDGVVNSADATTVRSRSGNYAP